MSSCGSLGHDPLRFALCRSFTSVLRGMGGGGARSFSASSSALLIVVLKASSSLLTASRSRVNALAPIFYACVFMGGF